MTNFLEKDSIRAEWALEEALIDSVGLGLGDEIGWFDDVEVYFSEDGGQLWVYAKGAADDAEPLRKFWFELSVSEFKF